MSAKPFGALMLAVIAVPTLAMAQAAQSPPTDPQSKRQQESPAVNSPAGPAGSSASSAPPSIDGTANTTIKTEPPITSTSPSGANPDATTGSSKTAPLEPKN